MNWQALVEIDKIPTVLVGDLNTTPWNHAFADLRSRGLKVLPGPFGIPLNHCLYRGLHIKKLEVCRSIGSDHRPIYAEVVAIDEGQ